MKKITLYSLEKLLCALFFVLFFSINLSAQMDTLIVGYQDGVTDAQKKILPDILDLILVDSIIIFNQYKYVMPDVILIDSLPISSMLQDELIAEFSTNTVTDAERKKRIAGRTSEDKMAGAEGMDLNLEISLNLPDDNSPPNCNQSYCMVDVTSPIEMNTCHASATNSCMPNNSVKVGVMDTGISPHHDLMPQLIPQGYDLVQFPNDLPLGVSVQDRHIDAHGTKVTGEIVASSCCSDSVQILSIRILDKNGQGYYWNMLKGVAVAIDQDVKILNISAGFTDTRPPSPPPITDIKNPLQKALEVAGNYNVLVITSAGNDTADNDMVKHFPSNYSFLDNVVAVAASCNNILESYSNFGQNMVSLITSGNHTSTAQNNGYGQGTGTSFAAAVVSGFAALLYINTSLGQPIQAENMKQFMMNYSQPSNMILGGELMPEATLIAWQNQFCFDDPPLVLENQKTEVEEKVDKRHPIIYPSPFQQGFTLALHLKRKKVVNLSIFDLNSQLIHQEQKNMNKGLNLWRINQTTNWSAGIYFVRLEINRKVFNYKIVKM